MLVRHNIDVMHVEKNVSDAILSLIMQNSKSKDGVKSRKDLEDMFQIPLFKCKWAKKGHGVKEEQGFTIVNLQVN